MRPSRLAIALFLAAAVIGAGAFTTFAAPALHHAAAKPKAAAKPGTTTPVQYCDSFLQDFAGKLGVKPDAVVPALKASIKDSIDQAQANGDMTAADATKARAKVDAVKGCGDLSKLGALTNGLSPKAATAARTGVDLMQAVMTAAANALKVTPADLQAAFKNGDSLSVIGGRTGVTRAAFDPAFKSALTSQLDPLVAAKKITAAQEAEMIAQAVKIADMIWDTPLNKSGGAIFGHAAPNPSTPGTSKIQ
jgi:hypothetical protein